jgi:hypothetical protein
MGEALAGETQADASQQGRPQREAWQVRIQQVRPKKVGAQQVRRR